MAGYTATSAIERAFPGILRFRSWVFGLWTLKKLPSTFQSSENSKLAREKPKIKDQRPKGLMQLSQWFVRQGDKYREQHHGATASRQCMRSAKAMRGDAGYQVPNWHGTDK